MVEILIDGCARYKRFSKGQIVGILDDNLISEKYDLMVDLGEIEIEQDSSFLNLSRVKLNLFFRECEVRRI